MWDEEKQNGSYEEMKGGVRQLSSKEEIEYTIYNEGRVKVREGLKEAEQKRTY